MYYERKHNYVSLLSNRSLPMAFGLERRQQFVSIFSDCRIPQFFPYALELNLKRAVYLKVFFQGNWFDSEGGCC